MGWQNMGERPCQSGSNDRLDDERRADPFHKVRFIKLE
jgi:hypothetical protein